jgi:hypothetical protein
MRSSTAALAGAGSAVVTAVVLLGVSMSSQGAPLASTPVTTPIAQPHASVAPGVAAEMNGKKSNVHLSGKVKMHTPAKGLTNLSGKGQGNGCLKNYGQPGQCLPVISPAQQQMPDMTMPWTCADVRLLFPDGLSVHGKDTLNLDSNNNGTLCDAGDA